MNCDKLTCDGDHDAAIISQALPKIRQTPARLSVTVTMWEPLQHCYRHDSNKIGSDGLDLTGFHITKTLLFVNHHVYVTCQAPWFMNSHH